MSSSAKVNKQFDSFVKTPNLITLREINAWFAAGNFRNITSADIKTSLQKFNSKTLDKVAFAKFLDELSKSKGISVAELEEKLGSCTMPTPRIITNRVVIKRN